MSTPEETEKAVEETRNRRRKVFNATLKNLKADRTEKSESKSKDSGEDG